MSAHPCYGFADGSRLKGNAQAVGERLDAIKKALPSEEKLPAAVVADARPKSSPLHGYFTWNDSAAAKEHRLNQARHLIRSVTFVFPEQPERETVKAFYTIDKPDGTARYITLADAMTDEEINASLVAQALREADQWAMRYRRFSELSPVFDGIAAAKKKTAPRATPRSGKKATAKGAERLRKSGSTARGIQA